MTHREETMHIIQEGEEEIAISEEELPIQEVDSRDVPAISPNTVKILYEEEELDPWGRVNRCWRAESFRDNLITSVLIVYAGIELCGKQDEKMLHEEILPGLEEALMARDFRKVFKIVEKWKETLSGHRAFIHALLQRPQR